MRNRPLSVLFIFFIFSWSCQNKQTAPSSSPAFSLLTPAVLSSLLGTAGPGNFAGQFTSPFGVAVDTFGNIYVSDFSNNNVQKFDSNGNFLLKWGSPGSGNGQFANPSFLAVDLNNNVYVADNFNYRIQVFDSAGNYGRQFGNGPGSGNGQFETLEGVAVDRQGHVFVADTNPTPQNSRIQEFDSTGSYMSQLVPPGGVTFGGFAGLALDKSGNLFAVDSGNRFILKYNQYGIFLMKWGSQGIGNGQFGTPGGIAVDGTSRIYVADYSQSRVQVFDSSGNYLFQWGSMGSLLGQYNECEGIGVGIHGDIYIGDTNNHRVEVTSHLFAAVLNTPLIAPNPVKTGQSAVFDFSSTGRLDFSIMVKDSQGDEINHYQGQSLPGNTLIQWNMTDSMGNVVSNSIYFVTFGLASGPVTEKLAYIQ